MILMRSTIHVEEGPGKDGLLTYRCFGTPPSTLETCATRMWRRAYAERKPTLIARTNTLTARAAPTWMQRRLILLTSHANRKLRSSLIE